MPNRIIKESICYSDDLDQLNSFEETVFYRLIVRVDDYGRLDARVNFLKNTLFVTKPGITEAGIAAALEKMAAVGLIQLYQAEGRPYLCLPKWTRHQQCRASTSKYPAPDHDDKQMKAQEDRRKEKITEENACKQAIADDSKCKQVIADDSGCPRTRDRTRIRNRDRERERERGVAGGEETKTETGKDGDREKRERERERAEEPVAKAEAVIKTAAVKKTSVQGGGEYHNVMLSANELCKLQQDYPGHWQELVEALSGYMASTGKKYKSHYVTMRNWMRRDGLNQAYMRPPTQVSAHQYGQRRYSEAELSESVKEMLLEAERRQGGGNHVKNE